MALDAQAEALVNAAVEAATAYQAVLAQEKRARSARRDAHKTLAAYCTCAGLDANEAVQLVKERVRARRATVAGLVPKENGS